MVRDLAFLTFSVPYVQPSHFFIGAENQVFRIASSKQHEAARDRDTRLPRDEPRGSTREKCEPHRKKQFAAGVTCNTVPIGDAKIAVVVGCVNTEDSVMDCDLEVN